MASENIGAVSNNLYMNGHQGFINKTGVQAAEAPVSFAALKKKEVELNGEALSRDSHYEQVHDQKAK